MEKFSPPLQTQNAAPSQDTGTKEVSLELPKEILEKVLEKTVDIDAYGTAFSVVGRYNPDSAKELREIREPYRLTFEDFKKQISESGYLETSVGRYKVPLMRGYGSCESMYQLYSNLKEAPDGKYYIDERLLKLVGVGSNEPVSEKIFSDKYNELLEKDISEAYRMYSQDFEEEIFGKSFEKYRAEFRERYSVRDDYIPQDRPDYPLQGYIDRSFENYKNAVKEMREKKHEFGSSHEYSGYYAKLFKRLGFDNRNLNDVTSEEFRERCKKVAALQEKEFEGEVKRNYEEYFASLNDNACKEKALLPFKSIFRNGIFGGRRWRAYNNEDNLTQPEPLVQTPEAWAKDVRSKDSEEQKKKERHVFFNIVGKFHNDDMTYAWDGVNHKDKMKDSQWFFKGGVMGVPKDVVAVIFDKEGVPFFSDDPKGGTPHSEHGYAGPVRVAPRKFLGVVVQCTGKGVYEDGSEMPTAVLNTDSEKWQRYANDLAETLLKTNETHPDRLIPIYDVYGNMLWPTKMTHEEIQNKLKEKTVPSI